MKIKRSLLLCSLAILILIFVSCSTVDTPLSASAELYSETSIPTVPSEASAFEVHFIDVGQADAALVLCDEQTMLIDGGNAVDSNWIKDHLWDTLFCRIETIRGEQSSTVLRHRGVEVECRGWYAIPASKRRCFS